MLDGSCYLRYQLSPLLVTRFAFSFTLPSWIMRARKHPLRGYIEWQMTQGNYRTLVCSLPQEIYIVWLNVNVHRFSFSDRSPKTISAFSFRTTSISRSLSTVPIFRQAVIHPSAFISYPSAVSSLPGMAQSQTSQIDLELHLARSRLGLSLCNHLGLPPRGPYNSIRLTRA